VLETRSVAIENDNGFRRMLDQCAQAGLAGGELGGARGDELFETRHLTLLSGPLTGCRGVTPFVPFTRHCLRSIHLRMNTNLRSGHLAHWAESRAQGVAAESSTFVSKMPASSAGRAAFATRAGGTRTFLSAAAFERPSGVENVHVTPEFGAGSECPRFGRIPLLPGARASMRVPVTPENRLYLRHARVAELENWQLPASRGGPDSLRREVSPAGHRPHQEDRVYALLTLLALLALLTSFLDPCRSNSYWSDLVQVLRQWLT